MKNNFPYHAHEVRYLLGLETYDYCMSCGRSAQLIGCYCLSCTVKIEDKLEGQSVNSLCESGSYKDY